jgi:hypothetical protein
VQTSVIVTISTTASTAAAMAHPQILYAAWLPFTGLGLLGIAFMIPGKRRKASTIFTLMISGVLMFAVGCGGSSSAKTTTTTTDNGTPQGSYTVTVTGTSSNVTQSTTFGLTVK